MLNVMKLVTRLGLTVALLIIVWGNSHWSVALTLTLLAIANELHSLEHALLLTP